MRAGRIDAGEIEAEAAADRTTAGAEYAAGALAARPTAEAKAAAWASVIDRDDLPNGTQDAIIGIGRNRGGTGFAQASQAGAAANRTSSRTSTLSRRCGPAGRWRSGGRSWPACIPRKVIAPGDRRSHRPFLAAAAPVPALRRLILEGRSEIVRALAARDRDAAG